jgi:DNA-binding Xre family transcriptional regulator
MAKKEKRKRRKEIDDPDLKKVVARIAANIVKNRGEESYERVAHKAQVSTSTVWEIAHAKADNIKLHTLVSIARALDLDLIDLLR